MMWIQCNDSEYTARVNKTDIEWLDIVIKEATELTARMIIDIMHKARFSKEKKDNGKLAESG